VIAVIIGFDGGITLVTAAGVFSLWALLRRRAAWSQAAVELGLTVEMRGVFGVGVMRGVMDGAPITVDEASAWQGRQDVIITRVQIEGSGHWPRGVSIASASSYLERRVGSAHGPVIDTGDPLFDMELRVRGLPGAALAMLDRTARLAALTRMRVLGPGWALLTPETSDENVIRLERRGRVLDTGQLVDAVRGLRQMAAAMSLGDRTIAQALAEHAADDIVPLRRRNLALLVELFEPGGAVVRHACAHGLADTDVDVRLIAASVLRVEAGPVLDAILFDETESAKRRIEALHLRLRTRIQDVAPVLMRALESPCGPLRLEAIAAIRMRHWTPARERLVELAKDADTAEAVAIARALAAIGDASTEPILLRWLASEEVELRLAAVHALARVGTAASVENLLALADGLLLRPSLRVAARDALRAVRSRLGPADAGRLSLVELEDEAGALSVTDDAAGNLSIGGEAP
jgi:hypothetical protein